jgi:hypothetical protein
MAQKMSRKTGGGKKKRTALLSHLENVSFARRSNNVLYVVTSRRISSLLMACIICEDLRVRKVGFIDIGYRKYNLQAIIESLRAPRCAMNVNFKQTVVGRSIRLQAFVT